jgi:peroxiredoxin
MDISTFILIAALGVSLATAIGLAWACYKLLLDRGRLLLRQPEIDGKDSRGDWRGLAPGSLLSDFALPALDGRTFTLSRLAERPLLLIFVQPTCLYSRALARELGGAHPAMGEDAPLPVTIVIGEAPDGETLMPFAALPGPVLFDRQAQAAQLTRVAITPVGYQLDAERRTVGPIILGPEALLAAARNAPRREGLALPAAVSPLREIERSLSPLPVGAEAPRFTLPTLTGKDWSRHDQRGQDLILVFSDPGCPPCLPLLVALGERFDPRVIVVSRGDRLENEQVARASGLTAPVLLQRTREVARAFGTLETPAAIQIDAAGRIAAGPVIGADAVLALIRQATHDSAH